MTTPPGPQERVIYGGATARESSLIAMLGLLAICVCLGCDGLGQPDNRQYTPIGGPYATYVEPSIHSMGRLHVAEKCGRIYRDVDKDLSTHVPCLVIHDKYLVYYATNMGPRQEGLYGYRTGLAPKLLSSEYVQEVTLLKDSLQYRHMVPGDGLQTKVIPIADLIKMIETP